MRKLPLTIAAFAITSVLAGMIAPAGAQTAFPRIGPETATYELSARSATRHHARRHSAHRRARLGACDGFHRCRCGVTAARKHGLPLDYRGHNLKQAAEWPRAFPRISSPAVGAVVYQHGGGPTGHVSTIVGLSRDRCSVTVYDDAGTYERNICRRGAVILQVSG